MLDLPVIDEQRADDWVAACPACGARFAARAADARAPAEPPRVRRCLDCLAAGAAAPGELAWSRRGLPARAGRVKSRRER